MQEMKKTITATKKKTPAKKATPKAEVKSEEAVKATAEPEVKQEAPAAASTADLKALLEQQAAQIEMLKQQLAMQAQVQPQVIVSAASGERVHFLWLANVSDDNAVEFGPNGMYGRIVGKTGSFYMPKDELSRILDSPTRYFLGKRWLIVVSGLSEEEREALGVNYKEKELLDVDTFRKLSKLPKDELCEVYKELCDSHKDMVAARLHEGFENGKKIDRELVVSLNRIRPCAAFKDIIETMNAADLT